RRAPNPAGFAAPADGRWGASMLAKMHGSDEARAIHDRYPAIDLHADTLMWSRWVGYDLNKRHDPPLPLAAFGGHVDVPRLIEGGVGAQFFGLVSVPIGQRHGLAAVIDEQIDALLPNVEARPRRPPKPRGRGLPASPSPAAPKGGRPHESEARSAPCSASKAPTRWRDRSIASPPSPAAASGISVSLTSAPTTSAFPPSAAAETM